MDPPVRREDDDPLVVHVAQEHHHMFPGGILPGTSMPLPHLVPVGQRRFVPVVPVGDENLPVAHPGRRCRDGLRVVNLPDPVRNNFV